MLCQLHPVELMSLAQLVTNEIAVILGFLNSLSIALNVKPVPVETIVGSVRGKMEDTPVDPFKVQVEIGLLGSDFSNIAAWMIVLCTQDHEDFPLRHESMLCMVTSRLIPRPHSTPSVAVHSTGHMRRYRRFIAVRKQEGENSAQV